MELLAESVDNEHVNSNRAALFYKSMTNALGFNAQSRLLTDTEDGALLTNKQLQQEDLS